MIGLFDEVFWGVNWGSGVVDGVLGVFVGFFDGCYCVFKVVRIV